MIDRGDKKQGLGYLQENTTISQQGLERLEIYVSLLCKWQPVQNLVSRETIPYVWTRHICDSVKPLFLVDSPGIWLDIGSGAGFPGLVIAIFLADQMSNSTCVSDRHLPANNNFQARSEHDQYPAINMVSTPVPPPQVHLVESNQRKASFLRAVIRETGLNAQVHATPIDDFKRQAAIVPNFILARAFAPLSVLLSISEAFVNDGAQCFFHKGKEIDGEIEDAANTFAFSLVKHDVSSLNMIDGQRIIADIKCIRRLRP